jgi:hypothetical protein
MHNQFDPEQWQGKRKEQVDYSHAIAFISIAAACAIATVYFLTTLI